MINSCDSDRSKHDEHGDDDDNGHDNGCDHQS